MNFELTLDGYLMVAMDGEEISDLRRRYDKAREADLTVEWLEGPAIGKFEPALSKDVVAPCICQTLATWTPGG